ncbi:PKD domain-containing protein [Euzebya sp.]|uniref:PKD domain-containing protein n=1 Tax=Euzebya sp. TaxID=1971409 RepID=UPI003519C107
MYPSRSQTRIRTVVLAVLTVLCTVAPLVPAAAVQVPLDVLVSADPANNTPHALNGRVNAIMPVGDRVIVGGSFTRIANEGDGTPIDRPYLFAFDAATGVIDTGFNPAVNGTVEAIDVSDDGTALFVGGAFSSAGGRAQQNLAKLDAATGAADPAFDAAPSHRVRDVVLSGSRVFIGGLFWNVSGAHRSGFAAVDAVTGAVDPGVDLEFADPFGNGGVVQTMKLDVTPDGTRVVAIGNFGTVEGQPRSQIVVIEVDGPQARVSDWHTGLYAQTASNGASWCSPSFHSYMRDVDIAPDGSYMVVVTTGAYRAGRLCDSSARWELGTSGPNQTPTWVNHTGGDTLYGVAVTGEAVYIGGHNRWVNNPFAGDRQGPGAVPREGLASLDPTNGLPFSWDPGRDLGVGVFDMVTSPRGLYIGSDTDRVGRWEYHGRLAMFPSATGAPIPPAHPGPIPGQLLTGSGNALTSAAFDGTTVGTPAPIAGLDWSRVRAAMVLSGSLYTAESDGTFRVRPFDGATAGPSTSLDLRGLTSSHFPVGFLNGMAFDATRGRLYYTVQGQNRLYYRYFTPENGVFGAETFIAAEGGPLNWSNVRGLHLHGDQLYTTGTDGNLSRTSFVDDAVVPGTTTVVSGPAVGDGRTYSGRGLTVHSPSGHVGPNVPPAARATVTCVEATCRFGSTGSHDPDGILSSFSWDFGDGTTASGPGAEHTFGDGAFTVTLTVTDARGASASTTVPVSISQPPVAAFDVTCTHLECQFDASTSTDGSEITSYAWDLGDGTTATGVTAAHTYANPGTYEVVLTVTDDTGLTATTSREVNVSDALEAITFLGSSSVTDNRTSFTVEVPDSVRPGDLMVLFASFNETDQNPQPTTLPGWTSLDTVVAGRLRTSAWWRIAEVGDETRAETLSLNRYLKGDVTLLAYGGTSPTVPVAIAAGQAETEYRTEHTTPVVPSGLNEGTVVSYWADRTSGTTSWSVPAGQNVRHEGYGLGGGRVSAVVADAAFTTPGDVGGITAVSDETNRNATTWSIVLAPVGVTETTNRVPVAEPTTSCIDLQCQFDASASFDVDGEIVDHVWDFGDGTTASGVTATHAYAAAGVYEATLTVTDDDGESSIAPFKVTVQAPAAGIRFIGASGVNDNASSFEVEVPPGTEPGDAMVLAVSTNVAAAQATPPAGWTSLGRIEDQSMSTQLFARVASAEDIGGLVQVGTSAFTKADLSLSVWEGTSLTAPVAAVGYAVEEADTASHTTPVLENPVDGGLVVSYWADKTSATTNIAPPPGHTTRRLGVGSGGGRITSLVADSGIHAAGPVGGATATSDSVNGKATMWTIVLAPR